MMTDKKPDNEERSVPESVDQDTDEHEADTTDASKQDASKNGGGPTLAEDELKTKRRRLQASISVRTLLVAGLIAALLAGIGVMAWLYIGAKHELDAQAREV